MNKNFRNSLFLLASGIMAVSCADYNVTDDFIADPDPTAVVPYSDLQPVKSYIDRVAYPNMSLSLWWRGGSARTPVRFCSVSVCRVGRVRLQFQLVNKKACLIRDTAVGIVLVDAEVRDPLEVFFREVVAFSLPQISCLKRVFREHGGITGIVIPLFIFIPIQD